MWDNPPLNTAPLLILEVVAILVLGLGLVVKAARQQGGRWAAMVWGILGGVLSFSSLWFAGFLLPSLLALLPNLLFPPDRKHPGGRLMLGVGAGLVTMPLVAFAAFLKIRDGQGEEALLLSTIPPLVPFIGWWVGWGVERLSKTKRPLALFSLLALVGATPFWRMDLTYPLLGLIAWLTWRQTTRPPTSHK